MYLDVSIILEIVIIFVMNRKNVYCFNIEFMCILMKEYCLFNNLDFKIRIMRCGLFFL